MRKGLLVIIALALVAGGLFAQDIQLSAAPAKLGVDVLDAIRMRYAARAFVAKDVSVADLSTLFWAGNGLKGTPDAITAASKAGRTIEVSGDVDYINIYLLNAKGTYRYVPESNLLKQVGKGDQRAKVTTEFIANSAFMVLFTCDTTKLPSFVKGNDALITSLSISTASYAVQNLSLAAASVKLGSIVMFNIVPAAASAAAALPKTETPLCIMQVGYTQ